MGPLWARERELYVVSDGVRCSALLLRIRVRNVVIVNLEQGGWVLLLLDRLVNEWLRQVKCRGRGKVDLLLNRYSMLEGWDLGD